MAKKFGGEPSNRMSNVVSGSRSVQRTPSTVYAQSPLYNPEIGMPSTRTTFGTAPGKTALQTTSGSYPRVGFNAITPPGTSSRMLSQKFSTKYKPGEYAAYRKAMAAKKPVAKPVVKPPAVVSNVTREKLSPTPAKAPAPKAVSMRTGDTTGVTTGKTTGTVSRTPGMATKTKQSAYGRQMANAARNQPAGPMGGGGRGGSLNGAGASRTSGGGGNLGGARGRISEPGGSKR